MTPDRLAAGLKADGKWCPGGVLTDDEGLAHLLGMSTRQLATWRAEGKGPAWAKLKRICYDLADVAEWMNSNRKRTDTVG